MRNQEAPRPPLDTMPDEETATIPKPALSKWAGAPSWARGIVIIIATIAASSAAIVSIIEAFG